jgi:hypothetical protein
MAGVVVINGHRFEVIRETFQFTSNLEVPMPNRYLIDGAFVDYKTFIDRYEAEAIKEASGGQ